MLDQSLIEFFPYGNTKDKAIYIRHDVDSSIIKSLPMAIYEYERGIKATYFILHFEYWEKEDTWHILRKIQDMGHEIGFHNSVVTEVIRKQAIPPGKLPRNANISIRKRLQECLQKMRDEGLYIRGTCEHGDKPCYTHRIRNRQVWDIYPPAKGLDQYKLEDFGLQYDCSYVNALKKADQYKLENTENHDEIFIMDSRQGWYGHTPKQVINKIKGRDKYIIHLNIHPERWL